MGRTKKKKDDKYSPTEIFRMCAYRGISYDEVVNSPYSTERGIKYPDHSKTSYPEGAKGTRGWGGDQENISDLLQREDRRTPPFSKTEMLAYLGLRNKQS